MPSVEELLKKSTEKKFIKKDRRPWDYDTSIGGYNSEAQFEEAPASLQVYKAINEQADFEDLNKEIELKQQDIKVTNKVTQKVTQELALIAEPEVKQETPKPKLEKDSFENGLDIGRAILIKREIQNLVGIQKKLFFVIFNSCVKEGALSTVSFSTRDFEAITQISRETVKTSLNRLFKKSLILRLEGKRAKGGYLFIGFDKEVWDICMQMVNENKTLVE